MVARVSNSESSPDAQLVFAHEIRCRNPPSWLLKFSSVFFQLQFVNSSCHEFHNLFRQRLNFPDSPLLPFPALSAQPPIPAAQAAASSVCGPT